MDNLLFSAQRAEQLNSEFRALDSKLFLFCHYSPLPTTGNAQTDVVLGILNLFRATSDSVPIWKVIPDSPRGGALDLTVYLDKDLRKEFKQLNNLQDHLRGYMAHNNHVSNGRRQHQHILKFEKWEQQATDYRSLSSPEGAALALEQLLEIGDRLELAYRTLIQNMAATDDAQRQHLIRGLVDQTMYWYLETTQKFMLLDRVDKVLDTVYHCKRQDPAFKQNRINLLCRYLELAGINEPELRSKKYSEIEKLFLKQAKLDMLDLVSKGTGLLPEVLFDALVYTYMANLNIHSTF